MRGIYRLSIAALFGATTIGAQTAPLEKPPAPGPLRPYVVPPVQMQTLSNGVRIALIEKHSMPIVSARIQVDAGAVREPAGKAGLAVLTASLLSEGTKELTGAQIAEKMAELGASFSTNGNFGSAGANVTSLNNVFPDALTLGAKSITEPNFAEADFTRVRTNSIAGFERNMATAAGVAGRVFSIAVFDTTSPYSRLSGGTKASLSGITRDDVLRWHQTMYAPANTTVMMVGDITPAQAKAAVEKALGFWSVPAPTLAKFSAMARPVSGTRIILVDRPGSVQSSMYVGQASIGWENPDYIPLRALAQILGGGFGARMNMNLRERHGWTYGAFATLNPLAGAGAFAITSEIRTNVTDSAIAESIRELRRIATEPVPAEETRDQINNIVASFPSAVQTDQDLLGRLSNIITYGLPPNFYSTYREKLAALTPADISRVAASDLTPNAITVVAVGDLKSIEAPIRALNLGTVEVWDANGNKLR